MLTLENFEQELDSEILQRGRSYYKAGQVQELEEVSDGVWEAVVSGTDDYDVTIEQTEDGLFTECTCPYDWGLHCKHVAAVLYAIRAINKGEKPRQTEKKTQRETARSVLERLSREELLAILMEQIKKDKILADTIILQYSQEEPDKATYVRLVQNALRAAEDRHGFIDYASARAAANGIGNLLAKAETLIDQGQATKALPVLQAVIETVPSALESADDSNGEISGCIDQALIHLENAAATLDDAHQQQVLDYCLTQGFEPQYQGWDYMWTFFQIAADLVKTPDQRARTFAALDRLAARRGRDHFYSEYDQESALHLKLSIMERQDTPEQIHAVLLEHKHLHRTRTRLVDLYLAQNQLAAASQLCLEAIEAYKRDKPGLVRDYQQYLLKIAEKEGNTERIVQLAETLLLEVRDFDQHYATLKRAVPKEQWTQFVEDLIKRIQSKPIHSWGGQSYLLGELYAREGLWDRLMNLAREARGEVLDRYRTQLEKRFPNEVGAVYEQQVYQGMQRASNRDAYREMCHLLRRIQQMGQPERVKTIVADLRAKYPKRRAMLEELDLI